MPEKHICMTCEEAKRNFIVDADASGKCSVCGSDKVVSASAFLTATQNPAVAASQKTKAAAPEQAIAKEGAKQRRIDNLADYYKPVRAFLDRNNLHDLNLWWDGWSFAVDLSILPDDSWEVTASGEFEWMRATLKNANGETRTFVCYFDPEEEARLSVGEIKRKVKN